MRRVIPVILTLLAACATPERPKQVSFNEIGVSTESQVAGELGQPMSRTVADDGSITDVFRLDAHEITLNAIPSIDANGKPALIPMADLVGKYKPEDLAVRVRYIYSRDGVLRKIFDEFPMIGADGQVQYHLVDPRGPGMKITRRSATPQ